MNWDNVQFWAKTTADGNPGISVRDHCLNVGCVAEVLLALMPAALKVLFPEGAATLSATHDVGKISPGFVVKCPIWVEQNSLCQVARREDWANHEPDHARVSQWALQKHLANSKLDPWAAIVGTHHGRIKGKRLGPANLQSCGGSEWERARKDLILALVARFGPLPNIPSPGDAVLWFVAGLITVADWIGSDEKFFSAEGGQAEATHEIAVKAVQGIGWSPIRFLGNRQFSKLFPGCEIPRPLQIAAVDRIHAPGLYIIEAQMGSGKTEAALAAAYRLIASEQARGLYFALPTQVTSNRIYERVGAFLAGAEAEPDARRLRLAHSTSWLYDAKHEEPPALRPAAATDSDSREHVRAGRSWFASAKRALLAPFGVGTIDQALLGIVAAKHFFVRQFGLAGKVVVLDEVHTYDLYTGTLLDVLIKRLRELHCTVILLSATLTLERRRDLVRLAGHNHWQSSTAYPLLTACTENQPPEEIPFPSEPPRTVRVQTSADERAHVAEGVMARASRGQCVLWVRNTVREAQETFRAVRNSNHQGGPAVALLHSRFPQFRREELESEWLHRLGRDGSHRPPGCVLVATQVVEQSVDIDADYLVTDLAPTDMMLQRLGRLWRHDRPRPPGVDAEMLVCLPPPLAVLDLQKAHASQLKEALGPSGHVYAPYVLFRSLAEWRKYSQVILPGDIRPLIEATYADHSDEPTGLRELRAQLDEARNKLRQLALNNTNVWNQPALSDEEGVQTRVNSRPSVSLVLATGIESTSKGRTGLSLLTGESIDASDHDWSFAAAKAIHRNLVRVPRYAVAEAARTAPKWLNLHISGECALGILRDGDVCWQGSERPSGLTWHPDEGVVIPQQLKPPISRSLEDDYESYE